MARVFNFIHGTDAADTLNGTNSLDIQDVFLGSGGADTLNGGAGNDVFFGGPGSNRLVGGEGDDTFYLNSNDQIIENTSEGIDTIYFDGGWVGYTLPANVENGYGKPDGEGFLLGLRGNDSNNELIGTDKFDRIVGQTGNDSIYGSGGNDRLEGDADDDLLHGGAGADTLNGGEGIDTASYEGSAAGVSVDLANGTAGPDTLIDVENAIGSDHADTLAGSEGGNELRGQGGSDTLLGRGGNDVLFGDQGDDLLDGGGGIDLMNGGDGNDSYIVDNAWDAVADASGFDTVIASVSFTLVAEIETLIAAGPGPVTLIGNAFNNTVTGSSGNDELHGGSGNDILQGGLGRDAFVFNTKPSKTTNVDQVIDFRSMDDVFRLDNAIFKKIGANGKLKADAFHLGRSAEDAEDRVIYHKASGALFYDADGTGSARQIKIATLTNKAKVVLADFVVI